MTITIFSTSTKLAHHTILIIEASGQGYHDQQKGKRIHSIYGLVKDYDCDYNQRMIVCQQIANAHNISTRLHYVWSLLEPNAERSNGNEFNKYDN